MAAVTGLITYPVKGCAGVPLTEAAVTAAGLAHDRTFMVVGADGVFRSQRRDPGLAVIRPVVGDGGEALTLRAPGVADLRLTVVRDAERCPAEMFGTPYPAIDQGPAAADWLTRALGAPSRLVRVPPDHDRETGGLTPGTSGFADSSALHVISQATLDDLNGRLARPLPMARFRPNIVIGGWDVPHLEDEVRRARIGNTGLGYAKPAIRCAVTMVDQGTGAKAGPEPLRTLAAYRRAAEGGVAFGAKFSVAEPGKVAVGDEVEVLSWATPGQSSSAEVRPPDRRG